MSSKRFENIKTKTRKQNEKTKMENETQIPQTNANVQQAVDQAIPEGKVQNWAEKEIEEINERIASFGNF